MVRRDLVRQLAEERLHGGEFIWAPAIDGGLLLSACDGDYELHLAQDLSIAYLSQDADTMQLSLRGVVHVPPTDRRGRGRAARVRRG